MVILRFKTAKFQRHLRTGQQRNSRTAAICGGLAKAAVYRYAGNDVYINVSRAVQTVTKTGSNQLQLGPISTRASTYQKRNGRFHLSGGEFGTDDLFVSQRPASAGS